MALVAEGSEGGQWGGRRGGGDDAMRDGAVWRREHSAWSQRAGVGRALQVPEVPAADGWGQDSCAKERRRLRVGDGARPAGAGSTITGRDDESRTGTIAGSEGADIGLGGKVSFVRLGAMRWARQRAQDAHGNSRRPREWRGRAARHGAHAAATRR
jgi:hypothetical protein